MRYDFISLSDVEEEFITVLEDDNTSKQSISYEEIMSAIDCLPKEYKIWDDLTGFTRLQ